MVGDGFGRVLSGSFATFCGIVGFSSWDFDSR